MSPSMPRAMSMDKRAIFRENHRSFRKSEVIGLILSEIVRFLNDPQKTVKTVIMSISLRENSRKNR